MVFDSEGGGLILGNWFSNGPEWNEWRGTEYDGQISPAAYLTQNDSNSRKIAKCILGGSNPGFRRCSKGELPTGQVGPFDIITRSYNNILCIRANFLIAAMLPLTGSTPTISIFCSLFFCSCNTLIFTPKIPLHPSCSSLCNRELSGLCYHSSSFELWFWGSRAFDPLWLCLL